MNRTSTKNPTRLTKTLIVKRVDELLKRINKNEKMIQKAIHSNDSTQKYVQFWSIEIVTLNKQIRTLVNYHK